MWYPSGSDATLGLVRVLPQGPGVLHVHGVLHGSHAPTVSAAAGATCTVVSQQMLSVGFGVPFSVHIACS
jgi:hypothetical protein